MRIPNKYILDKQMYEWLSGVLVKEGYYLETVNTSKGMKYKLLKDLRVVSEFVIDFNGVMLINGKEVEFKED